MENSDNRDAMPVIEAERVCYSYGMKAILRNLSFSVEEGEFCAVVGANGCGKTTLLRCVANLLNPSAGQIKLFGERVSAYKPMHLARKIALVHQRFNADVDFTAFDIVLMGRNPYQRRLGNWSQADHDIVQQCMEKTNTWHLRGFRIGEMSGGEMQRVMIARALAQQTPVLLLDEPTSNLDIAHQFDIMEMLRSINRTERKTIMIVVHDLNLALRYCPTTMVMNNGTSLYHGPTGESLIPSRIGDAFGVDAEIVDGHIVFRGRIQETPR